MKWLIATLVGALAIFLIFDTAASIKCYQCNSYFQKTCADWFDNRTYNLDQCQDGVKMCRKIVQEVYYNDEWNTRYIRQCAPTGEVGADAGRQCQERTGTYKVKMRYCHCDNQDGCNGAGSVNIPIVMMVLPALTAIFKKL
ncbi:uncharacterized protein LOC127867478 isoform X2 [Dreissena polymorpha]|uniref:Protein sleepless n=1 Tax=Dreissena polymorpha TaxID=45954 RepID=A0A9D4RG63_DREPO|nr:uncharacterized protein LOC127867447 [Dreissena polymorpha]XP_052264600.1 uncharacterized protein LOC127867478 isoform X2 [Dreissena polymorpha]KAH3867089.1 hypothetical protein DPMN_030214 [Dreissena polymorpha]KAH3867188.1 hypothetical protein DPMN_030313 [Dreissena polymorpha]